MTVIEAFNIFKTRLELDPSYDKIVQSRHKAIRAFLENRIPGIRTQLIGSLQRRTRIDPPKELQQFDIDILVEVGVCKRFVHGGITPVSSLLALERVIKNGGRYKKRGTETDSPALIVPYSDGSSIELVPAYRDETGNESPVGRAFWVPLSNNWHLADYDYDADYISTQNKRCDGLLIPCIKMLKGWRRNWVPDFRSFHLEILAALIIPAVVEACKEHQFQATEPYLISFFFQHAQNKLNIPVRLPGSLSEPVGNYLSSDQRNKIKRVMKFHSLAAKHALNNSPPHSLKAWHNIFRSPFPKPAVSSWIDALNP